MTEGILRNRRNDFLKAKGKSKVQKKRFSKASLNKAYDDEELMRSTLLSHSTKASEVEMTELQQPSWIQDYRQCCFILKEVQICREEIKKEVAKKLMAVKEQVHDRRIRLLADEATQKLRKCERKLKNIQVSNKMNANPQEQKSTIFFIVPVFTNIIVSLAEKIRTTTKQLRNDRQQQLSHQRQIKSYNKSEFDEEIKNLSEQTNDDWLSEEGLEQIENKLHQQRNDEIMKIVKSIHSLNSIYKELQSLVINQGSLLDRIDQNIETTHVKVQEANEHLKKAEQHQKSPFAKKVIWCLVTLIFIFFALFILKHS